MISISLTAHSQCGGLDIFIANDQSGSVDAKENLKSREFMVTLAQNLVLSNNAAGFRIAIADWDYNRGWMQYNFPVAGQHYTTELSDIVSYANSPRILSQGTDLVLALEKSYEAILAEPDKTRPKAILLLTDAFGGMAQPGLADLAEQIKNSGIYIAIMAIDEARYYDILADIASAGGYFYAGNYELLAGDATVYASTIAAAICKGNQPAFDLSIRLTGFNALHCFPGPGNYTLDYEIQNTGKRDWNDSITISLYDGDPQQYGTSLVTVFKTPKLLLATRDAYQGTLNSLALKDNSVINAIVNFDGIGSAVALPAYPYQLLPLLAISGERSSANNYSNPVARSNGDGCVPKATIAVEVQADNIGCGETAGYTVNICNTGDLDTRLSDLHPMPDTLFSLLYSTTTIDSAVTSYYNTYFGGANSDYAYSATVDPFGYVYITGQTNSANNIVTPGAWRSSNGGTQDAFLAKFDAAGKRVWATYFGGIGPENGYSVTTDSEGNIYITGETSISPNMGTAGSHQLFNAGNYDAYLAKFNANGVLLWSTYYGGSGADYGRSVITDNNGNVYLAGNTSSTTGIATTGAHQPSLGGGTDAFLVKFNRNGVRQWATYYGGTGTESGFDIAVDSRNDIYLTGLTASAANIATAGSFQPVKSSGNDAYFVKFNSNGIRQWGTYYGGNGSDNSTAIKTDREDNVYITGNTSSTNNIATLTAHQASAGGGTDAFLAKFDANGNRNWATYYGGPGTENGRHVNTDNEGVIYLSGTTTSASCIATQNVIQPAYGGNIDAYLVKFNKAGIRQWATYFGGTEDDVASAAVTDARGKIYMTGATQSLQLATQYSFQEQYGGGGSDAFLLKIDEESSFVLKAGQCITQHYYYNVSAATAGLHHFSYNIKADKIHSTDLDAAIRPDSAGFNGLLHTTDDLVVTHNAPLCATGDKLSVQVNIPAIRSCGPASYVTATIAINNTSGISINNTQLNIDLQGSAAFFSSELYGKPAGLILARPDISKPAYPEVDHALLQKSDLVSIPLYVIPPGLSTIKIDIATGTGSIGFSTFIDGVPGIFNVSGHTDTAISQNALILTPLPAIAGWNFPTSINNGESIQLSGITTTNAQSLQWVSATAGNLANNGTLSQPSLNYKPTPADIASGHVMLSLTILNEAGCDASQTADIAIDNVAYDYGDAPATYDLQQAKAPLSAASTLYKGLYLGNKGPSAEAISKHSQNALGDGSEEDGLAGKCALQPVTDKKYLLQVQVTNNTDSTACLNAFIDWNKDGDYLDAGEAALQQVIIPSGTGLSMYEATFLNPANAQVGNMLHFVRLRLSIDTQAIKKPFGPAAGGETEDHLVMVGCGEDQCGPFVPTAFTPNGDGNNETFGAVIRCPVSGFHFTVYNRWGERVFETTDAYKKWDGRISGVAQPTGAFIWQCSYNLNGQSRRKKGTVTLIR